MVCTDVIFFLLHKDTVTFFTQTNVVNKFWHFIFNIDAMNTAPDSIVVREATLADVETLRRFEQGVIHAERPFDVTIADDPILYYDLEAMIAAPHIALMVAVWNDHVVGSGYARIEDARPYLRHRQHAYLGFMYVVPEHRGKGINQKIIQALKQWSASRGITELLLEVYDGNIPAIRAYEKIGFKRFLITMRLA